MQYIDMHCDTIAEIWYSELRGKRKSLKKNDLMIDLEKLRTGECLCQNLGLFINLKRRKDFMEYPSFEDNPISVHKTEIQKETATCSFFDPWETACSLIRVFQEEMEANRDAIRQVTTAGEIRKNAQEGRLSALMTIEEGGCCKGSLQHLQELYDAGVRMMTLTWNYNNELGSPNVPDPLHYFSFSPGKDDGLKPLGFAFVEAMQELGILIDVSHLSDAGFWDVARSVKGPFVASHSNARALCGCGRNLTDEMIREIAEHGGVIGLNFCPEFLEPKTKDPRQSVDALVRHARHIQNVGGRQCLGIGTDFDGIDGLMDLDRADKMQLLAEGLRANGFLYSEIEEIFYKNVLRVYDEVLQ